MNVSPEKINPQKKKLPVIKKNPKLIMGGNILIIGNLVDILMSLIINI